ncbi:MAG: CoA-binding protein [Betaproteobacteria bacterium]|nr:CoA-binding protein [Betaproteobacteria bacterium]
MSTPLRAATAPRSIVVIGASDNPDKIGGRPLFYLKRFGFRGPVYAINPKRTETQGFPTFPSLDALPETPEAAVVAVPGELAVDAVARCAEAGVKLCVVMTSGFGETTTEEGLRGERRMREAARAAGMRVIGPNSQGIANFGTGAVMSFSSAFIELPPEDGPVGIVSQSGAMSVVPYCMLRERGIGVRYANATGNDCDVTVSELAAEMARDPELKLLLMYLEGIPDANALAQAAAVARERDLPIVALKSGRTTAGQQAARSHTGALANEDRVVDAFLERHGIWRANDLRELALATEMYLKGWRPGGRRLVAISNSGAVCVMAADAATREQMPIARLAPDTRAELASILPSVATSTNPIDITAALLTNSGLFGAILPVIARDPAADAFVIGIPVAGAAYDVEAFARDTANFAEMTAKPTVAAITQEKIAAPFKARGIPVFQTEADAVLALAQFIGHHERMRDAKPTLPAQSRAAGTRHMRNEADSLALLAQAGVPVVPHVLCRTEDEAAAAIASLGGPVVVKGCSRDVAHKSELGLVRVGLATEQEVRTAYTAMRETLESGGHAFDGVLVASLARGRRELMIGAHVDPVFGPVVVIGDGGKYVEAMPDSQLLLLPFDEDDVKRALSRLRIAPLVTGVRGEPPLDADAFARAAVAVGRLMAAPECPVTSLDVNPVLVGAAGEGCVALDAVVFDAGEPAA